MAQLQPRWPLKIDPVHGPYAAIEDVAKSIHQDFLQLLKTIPGEWPMRPDLGIGLIKFLFESPNSPEFKSVKARIKSQVDKYLKAVEVTKIHINSPPDLIDYNQVSITIEYNIKPLGISRTMGLLANETSLQEAIANLEPVDKSPYHVRGSL